MVVASDGWNTKDKVPSGGVADHKVRERILNNWWVIRVLLIYYLWLVYLDPAPLKPPASHGPAFFWRETKKVKKNITKIETIHPAGQMAVALWVEPPPLPSYKRGTPKERCLAIPWEGCHRIFGNVAGPPASSCHHNCRLGRKPFPSLFHGIHTAQEMKLVGHINITFTIDFDIKTNITFQGILKGSSTKKISIA